MPKKLQPEGKPVNPRAKGLEKVTFRLEPAQIAALKAEALRRATRSGSLKADASELVREAIKAWLARKR
jgi:hypothetical protein